MDEVTGRLGADTPSPGDQRRLVESEPFDTNVGAFLARVTKRLGDRMAFEFFTEPDGTPNRSITYRDLDTRVTRLASGFHRLGIRKGQHVGVMLPNSPAFMLTWLALARLGAVMVPINIRYTARELAYTLTDSDTGWLVTHADYLPLLPELGDVRLPDGRVIVAEASDPAPYIDWHAVLEGGEESFVPDDEPALDDLATIQYTSGTTGFPKGVMLAHHHWLVYAKVGTVDLRHLGIERLLLLHPYYYVAGQAVSLFGFFLGATIFVAPRLSRNRFMPWMRETRAQYAFVSHAICKHRLAPADRYDGIKFLHISAAFTKEVHEEIERQFGAPLRNAYGMTENSLATYMPLAATDRVGPDCIGIPVPFREVMIADADGNSLADEAVGEICVRGPGILLGYYNNPGANRDSFFGEWHRSGDRGYRDGDGYFHFLGRIKDVVRRSGDNISAVEVETVLVSMKGVERAAAVPVPDEMRGEELKVYVQLNDGLTRAEVPPSAIVAHCARYLASFKVPRYIEYRTELPTPGTADKIEKLKLIGEKPDLRVGSYDREHDVWL